MLTSHPPSSAEVKEWEELHLCNPYMPSWLGQGHIYHYLYVLFCRCVSQLCWCFRGVYCPILRPEDEGSMILRNVGKFLTLHTASHPKRQYSDWLVHFIHVVVKCKFIIKPNAPLTYHWISSLFTSSPQKLVKVHKLTSIRMETNVVLTRR